MTNRVADDIWLRLMRAGFKPLLQRLDWDRVPYTVVQSGGNVYVIQIEVDANRYIWITEGDGDQDWLVVLYTTLVEYDEGITLSGSYYHTGNDSGDQLASVVQIVKRMRLTRG